MAENSKKKKKTQRNSFQNDMESISSGEQKCESRRRENKKKKNMVAC